MADRVIIGALQQLVQELAEQRIEREFPFNDKLVHSSWIWVITLLRPEYCIGKGQIAAHGPKGLRASLYIQA